MTTKQNYQSAADVEKILETKFDFHLAHELPDSPEQRFLYDALCESTIDADEADRETELADMNSQRLANGRAKTDVGGGARREGPATADVASPLTNRGVSKYLTPSPTAPVPRTLADFIASALVDVDQRHGGYDGGVTVGFDGVWNNDKFRTFITVLEERRQAAERDEMEGAEITLQGVPFIVKASGAKEGAYYRYVIEGAGMKFYLHHNPQAKIQPVRLRYGAESLIGRDLFTLHRAVLDFLAELGFTVQKEKLSRVDMQVLVDCSMLDLMRLIYGGHAVGKSRKRETHETGCRFETYSTGSRGSIQLCLYDKKAELGNMMVSDPVKFALMLEHVVGDWFVDERPMTRIEFRLARAALKAFEINSVQDLHEKETALADWLTSQWFRILDKPKVRGHENTQEFHETWKNVRKLFAMHFPGPDRGDRPVQWKKRNTISCDVTALLKQGAGCFGSAIALCFGGVASEKQVADCVTALLEPLEKEIADKANAKAMLTQTLKGVTLGEK